MKNKQLIRSIVRGWKTELKEIDRLEKKSVERGNYNRANACVERADVLDYCICELQKILESWQTE